MKALKRVIKKLVVNIYYALYMMGVIRLSHRIEVATIDETIDMLLNTDNSLVRFGDGDLTVVRGITTPFQKQEGDIPKRLEEVIGFREDRLMVGILDMFNGVDHFAPVTKQFMKEHFMFYSKYYAKLTNPNKKYYNALFSRCYLLLADKSKSGYWFDRIKQIWNKKSVVVVEGETTLNGVFDDLFDNCISMERIVGPSSSAYSVYDKILEKCKSYEKDKLFLLSLGPTAKPLALDLYRAGYRVIDIGNLDMEYQYYLNGVTSKYEKVQLTPDIDSDLYKECMKKYEDQVVLKVL